MAETSVTIVAAKHHALDPYIKILESQSYEEIDVSFSSYLKQDNNNKQHQQKDQEDAELSIFEARRYFSESGNNERSDKMKLDSPRFSSVSSTKASSFTVRHRASSEASWNSQTGLLCNKNREGSNRDGHGSIKKGSLLGPKWFFRGRTCPCSNSKSVQVQETKSRIVESRTGSNRVVIHRNHQKVSSSDPMRLTIPSNTLTRSIGYLQKRESRESHVSNFSFPTPKETSQPSENRKNPTLSPTKPVLDPVKPVLNPVGPQGITIDEEATSDASSDLFELESFNTQPPARLRAPLVARNSIEETATSEYGYEPSEASVTWSVTTAEPASTMAANFSRIGLLSSSAYSGCDDKIRAIMVRDGQRLVQPFKSVSVQDDLAHKGMCNNGGSKLNVTTNRTMLDHKSSFMFDNKYSLI